MVKSAIILAAGEGKRLLPITHSIPKTMVEVNSISILENALNAFHGVGIDRTQIVVGHLSNVIMDCFGRSFRGMQIEYVTNKDFATTNSMCSLHMGLVNLEEETWVLEGDVFFTPAILQLGQEGDISWYADSSMKDVDGAYLSRGETGIAESLEIIRDLSLLQPGHCKSIGLLKLSKKGVLLLKQWLAKGIQESKQNFYYDLIIKEHLKEQAINIVDVKGHKWFEIDTVQDLERAKEIFR